MIYINNFTNRPTTPTTPTTPNRPTTPTTPNRSTSNQCSICLSSEYFSNPDDDLSQTQYVTSCGHVYHYQCIMTWTNTNDTCPICRNIITNQNNITHDNITNDNILISDNHYDPSYNYYTPPVTPRTPLFNNPPTLNRFNRTNYNINPNSNNNNRVWASQTRQLIDYNNNNNIDNDLSILTDLNNTIEEFINMYSNNISIYRINNINHIINLMRNEINYYQSNNQTIN
mgnify:CR=1 FL=1